MEPRPGRYLNMLILVVCLLGTAAVLFVSAQAGETHLRPATYGIQPTEILPTPWPTTDLPYMTPVPTNAPLPPGATPDRGVPQPTAAYDPKPSDPFRLIVQADRPPVSQVDLVTKSVPVIISGTVEKVYSPRWTTSDGARPANPNLLDSPYLIYTPTLVSVDSYLKGSLPESTVILEAVGGTIGQDSVQWASDDLYTYQVGDHVVVFLRATGLTYDGSAVWLPDEHYTVTPDGKAYNHYESTTLEKLIGDIDKALGSIHR